MIVGTKNALVAVLAAVLLAALPAHAYDVFVFSSVDEITKWLESEDWWGEENRGEQLDVN